VGRGHMASAGARAYTWGLGAEPPAGVHGAEPSVRGQGARRLCPLTPPGQSP